MEHNFKFGVSYAEQRPLTAPLPLCGDVCDAFRYAKDIGLDGMDGNTSLRMSRWSALRCAAVSWA